MCQETWELLSEHFARFPAFHAAPPGSDEISAAAATLGREFPEDYREFVARYGGAAVGSYDIFGLRRAEAMASPWSVVENTEFFQTRAKDQGWADVEQWLIISTDGFGNPIGLAADGGVWLYDHDLGRGALRIAASFEDFIRHECLQAKDRITGNTP